MSCFCLSGLTRAENRRMVRYSTAYVRTTPTVYTLTHHSLQCIAIVVFTELSAFKIVTVCGHCLPKCHGPVTLVDNDVSVFIEIQLSNRLCLQIIKQFSWLANQRMMYFNKISVSARCCIGFTGRKLWLRPIIAELLLQPNGE